MPTAKALRNEDAHEVEPTGLDDVDASSNPATCRHSTLGADEAPPRGASYLALGTCHSQVSRLFTVISRSTRKQAS